MEIENYTIKTTNKNQNITIVRNNKQRNKRKNRTKEPTKQRHTDKNIFSSNESKK